MTRPTKAEMMMILEQNGIDVPQTANITQIREVYDSAIRDNLIAGASNSEVNTSLDDISTVTQTGTTVTVALSSDVNQNVPAVNQSVSISAVNTNTTEAIPSQNAVISSATYSVSAANMPILSTISSHVSCSQCKETRCSQQSEAIATTTAAISLIPAATSATAIPVVSAPLSIEAQILQAQRERQLLLLQQEIAALRLTMQPAAPSAPIVRININEIEAMVPSFSADDNYDVFKWIEDMQDAFKILRFDDEAKLIAMRRLLSGTAKSFVRTLRDTNTFNALRDALILEFGRKYTNDEIYNQLRSRRLQPSETIHRYVIEMQEIASRSSITEGELASIIVDNLDDGSNGAAMLYGATSMRQLKDLLIRYERLRQQRSAATQQNRRPLTMQSSANFQVPNRASAQVNNASASAVPNQLNTQPSAPPAVDTSVRCFNCSQFGHYQSACPKPKRPDGSCFKCGELTHVYRNCPHRVNAANAAQSNANNRSNVNRGVANINQSDEELDSMRSVSVALGYSDLKCAKFKSVFSLFDSGSPRCFTRRSLLPAFKGQSLSKTGYKLGNIELMSYGKVPVFVKLSNKIVKHETFVVPDELLFTPLIFGRDFFRKAGIKLVCMKQSYCNKTLLNLNNNKNINDKLAFKLKSLGILRSLNDFDCNTDAPMLKVIDETETDSSLANFDTKYDLIGPDDHFKFLCAIDCTSDTDNKFDINLSLPADQIQLLRSALYDAYHNTEVNPTCYDKHCMKIETTQHIPVYRRPRRLSHQQRNEVRDLVSDLLKRNIIRPSNSPYASAIVPVPKKTGEIRLCVDYRPLNKVTLRDNHPLPLPDDCLEHLGNKKFFTILDLRNGFNQIKMHEDSVKYTSFVTPDGQYEYLRIPFGLKNGPAVFQRVINNILRDLIAEGKLVVYMDDIVVASNDFKEHLKIITEVIRRLRNFGLELNLKKCKFAQTEFEYLGFHADANGLRPSDRHIQAIKLYPEPKNHKQLKACNGLFSFFRKFVQSFSRIAYPLIKLENSDGPYVFSNECRDAFLSLKQKLVEAPVLSIFDHKRETELHCDACSRGFGASLMQKQDDKKFHPVAYYSKTTSPAESRLHSYELETLAVVYALRRFHTYFDRRPFKIVTDCDALVRTLANENNSSKIARWALMMEQYNYTVQHKPGKSMAHVDALSRMEHVGVVSDLDIDFQLRVAQSRDPEICRLREHLETADSNEYELKDEVVYQISPSGARRLYVPREMINNVIRHIHEKIGHLGIDKCCCEIKRHYWFPLMKTRVHNFIRNCLKCIVHSAPPRSNKRNLFNIPKTPLPFNTVHIDHLGPLPSVISKKKYILVVIDAFTKFTKLYAAATTKSKESCTILDNYFTNYSKPRRLISDRGTSFTSEEFKKFLEERNIQHILNATASPQANGQVERVNRVLAPLMRKLCNKPGNVDWSHTLPKIEHILNNTVHSTTKELPSVLLFGVPQRDMQTDELTELLDEKNSANTRDLEKTRDLASQNILKSQFLKRNKPADIFKKGDYVAIKFLNTSPGANKKLDIKFRGPYMVKEILPHDRYVICDIDGCQITQIPYNGILEASKLKKWASDSADLVIDESPEEAPIGLEIEPVETEEEYLDYDSL